MVYNAKVVKKFEIFSFLGHFRPLFSFFHSNKPETGREKPKSTVAKPLNILN